MMRLVINDFAGACTHAEGSDELVMKKRHDQPPIERKIFRDRYHQEH